MTDQTIPTKPEKFTAHDMRERLRAYHEGPEWVLQFEVANGTGGNIRRHADAVAMSIWPSRGYKIIGYEIKVSRSDWLNELKAPQKADAVAKYCDAWFLVAPAEIVHEIEVPESWGWLIPFGKSLRIKKHPKPVTPEPVSRQFMAALLRNNHAADEARVRHQAEKLIEDTRKRLKEQYDRNFKVRTQEHDALEKAVRDFEEKSGLRIHAWGGNDLGKKVKMLEAIGVDEWSGIPSMIRTVRSTLEALEMAHQKFTGIDTAKEKTE